MGKYNALGERCLAIPVTLVVWPAGEEVKTRGLPGRIPQAAQRMNGEIGTSLDSENLEEISEKEEQQFAGCNFCGGPLLADSHQNPARRYPRWENVALGTFRGVIPV